MPLTTFHPVVGRWFDSCIGVPSEAQSMAWPIVQSGRNLLLAAPTGSGKTLAAFLSALDSLLRRGDQLPEATEVLYVSPLRALGNDVQKNLQSPLAQMRAQDDSLPDVRVLVRSGDTPASQRQAMTRKPPHILVTTPESLYILLTSAGGRRMLSTVRTVIVDEIHAVLGDKRGSHLSLSLERLEELTERAGAAPLQRIGLSATQKPVEDVARFLVGTDRECEIIDVGHRRTIDLEVEVPGSPLEPVCSHETWAEIYGRIAQLIAEHRTTLVFVNTRKLAERVSAELSKLLGEEAVTCHHSSLSKERRLDAEERLKGGQLRALVTTASLELGIDVGEVDLVVQVGSTRSIATLLQRVGRAGHSPGRVPRGRIFPLTPDELAEAAGLLRAVDAGTLDRTPQPGSPLDILAQQVVAACVGGPAVADVVADLVADGDACGDADPAPAETTPAWDAADLFTRFRRAWPYRELTRESFDATVALHTRGRHALLHRDGIGDRLMATKRARITAITGGGAIPDTADYRVLQEPEGTFVGTINEDFAIESSAGDIFQLGNTSWQVLKVEPGIMRVADARGAPPTLPFWLGEAPARTRELASEISRLRAEAVARWSPVAVPPPSEDAALDFRAWLESAARLPAAAAIQLADYYQASLTALGTLPTQNRVVLERFFDETGGMQLVMHSPFGGRINRAWGLALRKRFCVGFGFELQAAAGEDAIIISLGPHHSFPLEDVFEFLHPSSARRVLEQALLASPFFENRWRWNVSRALLLPRTRGGKRVPVPLLRMRAQDLLVEAFPEVVACPETLGGGELPIPADHPMVQQTIHDCLTEVMDVEGFLEVLRGLHDGSIEKAAVDTPEPSPLCRAILNAAPYSFLDDAPLEERRTQAVLSRRILDVKTADELGALDPEAVQRVKDEAWPQPESVEELHETLLWIGYITDSEATRYGWNEWLAALAATGRALREPDGTPGESRWLATEVLRDPERHDPVALLRGRMEALGPVFAEDLAPADRASMLALESAGHVLRARLSGKQGWCDRRLLARIQRTTVERLRQEIAPVTAAEMLRFLAAWQHADPEHQLEGPEGVRVALEQLAGFEAPARAWESSILPSRVRRYRREWLDQLTAGGELAWGRLWGTGACAVRAAPLAFVRREELAAWTALSDPIDPGQLPAAARAIFEALQDRGALFPQELIRAADLLPAQLEEGIGELIARGALTCDSFMALRQLLVPPSRRRRRVVSVGRYSLFRAAREDDANAISTERVARQLLDRYGVVFRRLITRERIPVPWRDLARVYRTLELRGEIRGGRFVAGMSGEQFALAEAISLLRRRRRLGITGDPLEVSAADPLNLQGILTPADRVSPSSRSPVQVG